MLHVLHLGKWTTVKQFAIDTTPASIDTIGCSFTDSPRGFLHKNWLGPLH